MQTTTKKHSIKLVERTTKGEIHILSTVVAHKFALDRSDTIAQAQTHAWLALWFNTFNTATTSGLMYNQMSTSKRTDEK